MTLGRAPNPGEGSCPAPPRFYISESRRPRGGRANQRNAVDTGETVERHPSYPDFSGPTTVGEVTRRQVVGVPSYPLRGPRSARAIEAVLSAPEPDAGRGGVAAGPAAQIASKRLVGVFGRLRKTVSFVTPAPPL
jgi:hypothetical protein